MAEVQLNFELWPKQVAALTTPATELLFGGASEGGKSHLLRVALCIWCLGVPGLQCVLIRKKYDDIIRNHVEGPTGFRVLLAPIIQNKKALITREGIKFANGSNVAFLHCQDERQFDSAQGVEKHVIAIDEATQISERLIRVFRAWCRVPQDWAAQLAPRWQGFFPRIIYTANPIGVSAPYFRRAFVKARAAMEVENVDGFKRQYIPSRSTDNKSVDQDTHKGRLAGLGDPALARALDEGDWDAPVGEFFPMYADEKHCCPNFTPPAHWFKFLSFDWGSADPFAVGWWAVSDGEPCFTSLKRELWFPRGALVQYREWYGGREDNPAKGLELSNAEIAKGIIERTREKISGLVVTDSKPFQSHGEKRGGKKYTISDVFRDNGVPLVRGNTHRVPGWAQLRDRLIGRDGQPLIYFQEQCRASRDYIPALARSKTNPEDAEEDGEATHVGDMVRYACTTRPLVKDAPKEALAPTWPRDNLTPAALWEKLKQDNQDVKYTR